MTNKDIITQYVNTGIPVPIYQINKLSNNLKKSYFRKRLQMDDLNSEYTITSVELEQLPLEYHDEFLNKIGNERLLRFIYESENPSDIVKIFGRRGQIFINRCDWMEIKEMLRYAKNPASIVELLGDRIDNFVYEICSAEDWRFLLKATKPIELVNSLGDKVKKALNKESVFYRMLISGTNYKEIIQLINELNPNWIKDMDKNYFLDIVRKNTISRSWLIDALGSKFKQIIEDTDQADIEFMLKAMSYKNDKDALVWFILMNKTKTIDIKMFNFLAAEYSDSDNFHERVKKNLPWMSNKFHYEE
jgi:hypothetical protein